MMIGWREIEAMEEFCPGFMDFLKDMAARTGGRLFYRTDFYALEIKGR